MKRIIFVLAIICSLFFNSSAYAEVIEVSKPPEITEIKFNTNKNIFSSTDSWGVNCSIENIDPDIIDYIKVRWYPSISSYGIVEIKLYYNHLSGKFEGKYDNINGLKEATYNFFNLEAYSTDGRQITVNTPGDIIIFNFIVNNNCAKNYHTVYPNSYVRYRPSIQTCSHRYTMVRRCVICKEITDIKYCESTLGRWKTNSKKEIGKICNQCNQWVKVPLPKKGTIITYNNYMYRIIYEGKYVELISPIKKEASVVIPSSILYGGLSYRVTSIAAKAFKNNTKLKKLIIYPDIKTIGKQAFYGCKNLKKITIFTTNLTSKSIGSQAFTKAGSSNYKKLVVSVPKSKKKSYIKLLRKSGLSSKVKIK